MSRTTRCLFALGLSVSLAAACGDDDDDGFGIGGSGGRAGGGGSGGRAGAAGAAGASGAAGAAGDAGSGGTGGSGTGGTGGSGTGGSGTGGTGGSGTGGSSVEEPPDGGADAAVDGGDETPIVDAGPEPIACPDDLAAASADADSSNDTQQLIITRLVFVGGDAPGCADDANGCIQVTFRSLVASFPFSAPLQLCTGSQAIGDCDDGVQALDASGDGDASAALNEGEEITYTTGLGEIATAASGELALVNGEPAVDEDPIIWAYINWGDYVSLPATVGPNDGQSLEEAAAEEGIEGVWSLGDSVQVNGQTTIYATGDVVDANDFEVCTQ